MAKKRRRSAGSPAAAPWIRILAFLGLSGLLAITPYFRGLYFTPEQLTALAAALILLILLIFEKGRRGEGRYLFTWLDLPVWALWAAYLLSTLTAAEPRAAVQEDAKYLLYALVYWLVRELVTNLDTAGWWPRTAGNGVGEPPAADRPGGEAGSREPLRFPAWLVPAVLVATGFGVALVGIGAVTGDIPYKGAYAGGRIFSVFQYPNTTASYLTAVYLAAAGLWSLALERQGQTAGRVARLLAPVRYLLAGTAAAVFFVFVFTLSRGAWLVFPVVALLYWVLLPKGHRLAAFLFGLVTVSAFIPAALLYNQALTLEEAARGGAVWRAWLVALLAAVVLNALVDLFLRLKSRARFLALAVLLGGGMAGLAGALLRFGLPEAVARRLESIGLEEFSAWTRIQWSIDGFQIFKDHPLLGAGGGGWNALYHLYQSYGYSSTQVHNHFVQVAIETGIVGTLAFLALWAGVLWVAFRLLRLNWREVRAGDPLSLGTDAAVPAAATAEEREPGDFLPRTAGGRILLAAVLSGILALGLHAVIDFNLSLSAVSIVLWGLFALVPAPAFQGRSREVPTRQARRRRQEESSVPALGWVVGGTALVLFAGTGFLIAGHARGQEGAALLNAGKILEAAEKFDQATRFDPLTASFWIDLGQARQILAGDGKRTKDMTSALAAYRRGVALAPFNANYRSIYAEALLQVDYREGLAQLEKAVEYNPYEPKRYENLAKASMSAARQLFLEDRVEEAEMELARTLHLREVMRERAAAVPEEVPPHLRFPERTPLLSLLWGQALALQGEGDAARAEWNRVDGGGEVRTEALLWLVALARVEDRPEEAARFRQQAIEAGAPEEGLDAFVEQLAELMRKGG